MDLRNSTIELPSSFQPEIRQESSRKKLQENQIKTILFFNQSYPNGQKIHAWKSKAYSNKIFGQKRIDTFREVLPAMANMFHIKQ